MRWLLAALSVLSVGLCSCSAVERAGTLIGVTRQAPAVPPAPQPEPDHLELRSGAADFGARVLARVNVEGARPAGCSTRPRARRSWSAPTWEGRPSRGPSPRTP